MNDLSTSSLLRALYDQQQASMRRMLEAWDQELDAQAEAFKQAQAVQAAQANVEALDAAAIEVYLQGLIAQAEGGSDVSVSIPSGVRVASNLAFAPNIAELGTLIDQIDETESEVANLQRSAAWALGHGLMPHPGDLSDLMHAGRIDAPWADRLSSLSEDLARFTARPTDPPKLTALAAHGQVLALKDQVAVMKAYGADRTVALVRNPTGIATSLDKALPKVATGPTPKMGHEALGKMLDGLFKR